MPMLSRTLEKTLRRALALANARQHEYATLEHLLMALTEDQDAVAVLKACAVELERLRASLSDFLDQDLGGLVVEGVVDAKPTAGFQRVIQRAAIHVQSSGRSEVTGRQRSRRACSPSARAMPCSSCRSRACRGSTP